MGADTRQQLLAAATRQFADRGFYGTSIASIAAELDLTKQALLHHFGSKEKLYGEILGQISARALTTITRINKDVAEPHRRLEEAIVQRYLEELQYPDEARLLMRELLDNEQRAANAGNWYLRPYLDALVLLLQQVDSSRRLSQPAALAVIYQMLGAANYFALSQPTLRHMFGAKVYDQTKQDFEASLRDTIRRIIGVASA